jgi:hypothetical protein
MSTPATVNQVATAIQTKLATISGLRTYSYQPEAINPPPVAYPELTQVVYHRSMGNGTALTQMEWLIHCIVGRYTDRTAHDLLDQYLSATGAKSVRAAIEADTTLGGVVQASLISTSADISSLTTGDAEFLQIQFTLTVHT